MMRFSLIDATTPVAPTRIERRHRPDGPLADLRGAAGRTRAITLAVRVGLSSDATTDEIENLIRTAELVGLPLTLM